MAAEQPQAPESLPDYLADGLPKQDIDTLHDVIFFAEALIDHKNRPAEIPDDAEPVDDEDSETKGTVVKEKVKCGDESCHCYDGEKHGPYRYRYFRDEKGKLNSEYLGKV